MGQKDKGRLASALRVGLLVAVVATGLATQSVEVSAAVTSPAADPERVWAHLVALQAIGDREGGNRAVGTSGYAASVTYARTVLKEAGWTVTVQRFTREHGTEPKDPPTLAQVSPAPATYVLDTDFAVTTPPVEGNADAPLALVGITGEPDPSDGSTACLPGAFDGFPRGAIALVVAGTCDPFAVGASAFLAGATGLGFISDGAPGGEDPVHVTVIALGVATFSLSHALGVALVEKVRSVGSVRLRFDSGWRPVYVTSDNVIAERAGNDPSRVLFLGAHLDSVPAGPGVNDNGSGVSALLALAEAWGASGQPTVPTLRIGLWGAEERGLIGSKAYVDSLSAAERASITAYLNFDMVGSGNGYPFIMDPATARTPASVSPGSEALTERFRRHFDAAGIPHEGIWSNGRSDDYSFAVAGVPVGGLTSGIDQIKSDEQARAYGGVAGLPMDPCYHQACDRLDRINDQLLYQLVAGLSAVTGELAAVPVAPTTTPLPTTTTAPMSMSTTTVRSPGSSPASPVVATPAFTG